MNIEFNPKELMKARISTPRTQWEYFTSTQQSGKHWRGPSLDELGTDCWELVSVTEAYDPELQSTWTNYYFKRPKAEPKTKRA